MHLRFSFCTFCAAIWSNIPPLFIYYTLVKHVHTWEVALPAVSGLRFLLNAAKKEILSIPAKLNLQYRVPSKGHLEQGLFSVVASTKLELFFFFFQTTEMA